MSCLTQISLLPSSQSYLKEQLNSGTFNSNGDGINSFLYQPIQNKNLT